MDTPTVGLFAMIRNGDISASEWRSWADRRICEEQEPDMWLIDLSVAENAEEACKAIAESIGADGSIQWRDLDETILGLICYRYLEKKISLRDFLLKAGDHTDPSSCGTDCEYFYRLLNNLESSKDPKTYEEFVSKDIQEYLKEAIELANEARNETKMITEQSHLSRPV